VQITDNSKTASYMAKDVLAMDHGKEILEGGEECAKLPPYD
jgi:hypothetical protein